MLQGADDSSEAFLGYDPAASLMGVVVRSVDAVAATGPTETAANPDRASASNRHPLPKESQTRGDKQTSTLVSIACSTIVSSNHHSQSLLACRMRSLD